MADNVSVKGGSLDSQIKSILDASEAEIRASSKVAAKAAAEDAVRALRATSPRQTGSYAKGWKSKATEDGYVVYNATDYQLTHLLENGHDIVSHGKKVGHYGGKKHIKPVEESMKKYYEEQVKQEIERRLAR